MKKTHLFVNFRSVVFTATSVAFCFSKLEFYSALVWLLKNAIGIVGLVKMEMDKPF